MQRAVHRACVQALDLRGGLIEQYEALIGRGATINEREAVESALIVAIADRGGHGPGFKVLGDEVVVNDEQKFMQSIAGCAARFGRIY